VGEKYKTVVVVFFNIKNP